MIEVLDLDLASPTISWIDETTERPLRSWPESDVADGFQLEIRKSSKRSADLYFAPRVDFIKKTILVPDSGGYAAIQTWRVYSYLGSGMLATLDRRRGTLVVTHGRERLELHQYVVLKAMAARYLELTS